MIASLLSELDANLHGFKDQIPASETLATVANAYSQLLHSIIGIKLFFDKYHWDKTPLLRPGVFALLFK